MRGFLGSGSRPSSPNLVQRDGVRRPVVECVVFGDACPVIRCARAPASTRVRRVPLLVPVGTDRDRRPLPDEFLDALVAARQQLGAKILTTASFAPPCTGLRSDPPRPSAVGEALRAAPQAMRPAW